MLMMISLLSNKWFLLINSVFFWLTPITLAINLAIVKDQPNTYKKKIGYFYGSIWAIAFALYLIIFIFHD